MNTAEFVEYLLSLVEEIEKESPIDWGMLAIDEEAAYRLCALNLVELFGDKYLDPDFKDVAMAIILKLTVENFVLNLKLLQGNTNGPSM